MAKKTSSIHIENKLWDYIAEYQAKNGIDSRNTAIEWILVEHRGKCSTSQIVEHEENSKDENIANKPNIEQRESDLMLKQMEDEMPD